MVDSLVNQNVKHFSKTTFKQIVKFSLKIVGVLFLISLIPICYRKEYLRKQYSEYCNRSFFDKTIYGDSQQCELYKLQLNAMQSQCIVGDIGLIRKIWTNFNHLTLFPKIQSYVNHILGY